jgi:hypothetical protein
MSTTDRRSAAVNGDRANGNNPHSTTRRYAMTDKLYSLIVVTTLAKEVIVRAPSAKAARGLIYAKLEPEQIVDVIEQNIGQERYVGRTRLVREPGGRPYAG